MNLPKVIPNWIDGAEVLAREGARLPKLAPASGAHLWDVTASQSIDVEAAVASAKRAQEAWADTPAVERGLILHAVVRSMQDRAAELAEVVAAETGKGRANALGEVGGSAALGLFYASEGQRLYGRTTTSGVRNKQASTVRQPIGVAGLIIAANTPIANVAWKVFPALICGNSAVLKAAEDTPATAWLFAKIAHEAGLPAGVLNVVQGFGPEAGAPLVEHPDVGVVSFTGSSGVGLEIAQKCARRLARVSLELGGKNPLVVCDDADLENAVKWVLLSAFSNAGQRCASGSRIIIFDSIYDRFRDMLVAATAKLTLGEHDGADLGPVINERQLTSMVRAVDGARTRGAEVLIGGGRASGDGLDGGFFMEPTLVEGVDAGDDFSATELFGPIASLYRVADYHEALALANDSPYGLTACIHTRSFSRAHDFCNRVKAGVAVVNAGTYGSEPHMPFGGLKRSGNGTREPGTEALDVYSELKDVYLNIDPEAL